LIQADSVTFAYPDGPQVFLDFHWQVKAGESWAVLGPSGCGKTTLLYLLAGLRLPDRGAIRVGGERLARPRPGTGLILQDYGLLPWATVRENIGLGLRIRGFYGPDGLHAPAGVAVGTTRERVDPWLARMGILEVADQYPAQVSGGQRQRAAIARTLALDPDLLLMDEPFASLDAPTRESLQDLTLQLRSERRLTTVLVTHAIEEAAVLGQRILILGRPPTGSAPVIENPESASPRFRETAEFHARCVELRAALEAVS
jgi:ABC-type nitrate/sulfonate/bicarbonate transport system ATPase subunit